MYLLLLFHDAFIIYFKTSIKEKRKKNANILKIVTSTSHFSFVLFKNILSNYLGINLLVIGHKSISLCSHFKYMN